MQTVYTKDHFDVIERALKIKTGTLDNYDLSGGMGIEYDKKIFFDEFVDQLVDLLLDGCHAYELIEYTDGTEISFRMRLLGKCLASKNWKWYVDHQDSFEDKPSTAVEMMKWVIASPEIAAARGLVPPE